MPPIGVKRKAETSSNTKDDCRDVKIGKSRVMKVENEQEDWDKTDKIVQISSKAKKIIGFHLMPTCLPEPQKNEDKGVTFHKILKDNLLEHFQIHWNENKQFENEHFEIIAKPWKVCVLKNLLDDASVLNDVRQEFYEMDWNKQ
ncbi:hypothetical protein QE152_g39145 [Popillia japonica]|uniref:Uncharacterized protein n=1 Tax=Popillia japonica TaxID=7064 RepID=A0AAW1HUT6_POPJA